ncbi:hypothetical protein L3X38_009795 [Prunus dulcis]|uniref:Uncharacterized protein n=1 Tax=Prunus dulcis TaxID=3755 RepID=A0AAD4ZDF4_PRUDU|nr:hypothetical protein L3X38_009795 [Prunus dulcis]
MLAERCKISYKAPLVLDPNRNNITDLLVKVALIVSRILFFMLMLVGVLGRLLWPSISQFAFLQRISLSHLSSASPEKSRLYLGFSRILLLISPQL